MPDDQLPFDPADHDLRVLREGWVFYVRAVRRGESLAGGGDGGLEGLLVSVVFRAVLGRLVERWQHRQPWKVGVVRMPRDRWGPTGRTRVVHQELVTGDHVPAERLGELADRVRAGEYDG